MMYSIEIRITTILFQDGIHVRGSSPAGSSLSVSGCEFRLVKYEADLHSQGVNWEGGENCKVRGLSRVDFQVTPTTERLFYSPDQYEPCVGSAHRRVRVRGSRREAGGDLAVRG